MSRFGKWLRMFSQAGSPQGRNTKRLERVRLFAEALEDRTLRSVFVKPHFGAETPHDDPEESISSANVELIFWGPQYWWTEPSGYGSSNLMQLYSNAANKLLSSGYTSGVTQYGSDGKAQLFSITGMLDTDTLPVDIGKDEVENEKDQLQSQGKLPTGPNMIYAFVTPSWVGHDPTVGGINWVDDGDNMIWDVSTANGISNNVDGFTATLGHELVESMSSPDGDGFMVNPGANWPGQPGWPSSMFTGWGQIADFEAENNVFHLTNGVQAQAYWSQADQAFILPDGNSAQQFVLTPIYNSGQFFGYTVDVLGFKTAPQNDQFAISMVSNPISGTNEIAITANGETVWLDYGLVYNINLDGGGGQTNLTLNSLSALPGGSSVSVSAGGDLQVIYAGTVSQNITVSANGKVTVVDRLSVHSSPVVLTNTSITVEGNAALQYAPVPGSAVRALELDGGNNLNFTIQSTPSNVPLTIGTTYTNDGVTLLGLSGPVTISTPGQDVFTASVQAGGQWTLNNSADPHGVDITIQNNTVQYHNYVTLTLPGIQGLTMNASAANTHFIVQSTGTAEPLTINTGAGANIVDVAAAASSVIINANGTDTVNVGSAQTLDGVAPVTVHGNGNTTLTLNDQNTHLPASYALTTGRMERDAHPTSSSTTTTLFNYDHVKTLTLTASNNDAIGGGNVIDIEVTSAPTYVNGGYPTTSISVDPNLKNLDNIGAPLSIAGPWSPVSVYDQANTDATSGTPLAYALGDGLVTRDALVRGLMVHTQINTLPVQSVTLYTSQTSGSHPNTVSAGSASLAPAPVTLNSGAADAITVVARNGQLTVDAHGGTIKFDDRGLQNTYSPYTTDPQHTHGYTVTDYTLGYTVTDHTVGRSEQVHWSEVIYPDSRPQQPVHSGSGNSTGGPVTQDYYFNATLNYQNVKGLTIAGGQVDSTFTVQSTPTGMPVVITGNTSSRVSGPGTSGGSTVNRFIVGFNSSVKSIRSQLTFNAGSASDTLLVDDSQATLQDNVTVANGSANDVQLGMAATDQFFGSGGGLDCIGMGSLTLSLSKAANDKVSLSPSAVTAFAIIANGTGAELDVDLTGVTNPQQTGTSSGKFTFGNRKAVSFQNFGTVHAH